MNYDNLLSRKGSKEIKSINSSNKSAKKLFINLNNNSKINLNKNGICLSSNKSKGKRFIIVPKTKSEMKPKNLMNNKNNDYYKNSQENTNMSNNINNINKKNTNNYLNVNKEKSNLVFNNVIKDKNENRGTNFIIENNKININESIEKFEQKLKNYYQYSPEIKSKKTEFINYNKNKYPTQNNNYFLKLTPIELIEPNSNNDIMNIADNGKKTNLMEFVNNLNNYIPEYKLNNQIPNGFKRNKSKSKSVCENENLINYEKIQKQININKNQYQNNNFFINNKNKE